MRLVVYPNIELEHLTKQAKMATINLESENNILDNLITQISYLGNILFQIYCLVSVVTQAYRLGNNLIFWTYIPDKFNSQIDILSNTIFQIRTLVKLMSQFHYWEINILRASRNFCLLLALIFWMIFVVRSIGHKEVKFDYSTGKSENRADTAFNLLGRIQCRLPSKQS